MLLQDLLNIELPIIQAPMAGAQNHALTVAVSNAGGLGSLPAALLSAEALTDEIGAITKLTSKPFNLNFFCHAEPGDNSEKIKAWKQSLDHYYQDLGVEDIDSPPGGIRMPFDERAVEVVEKTKPPVVSFHFGLPKHSLLARVKSSGAKIMSTATTVEEGLWLQERGVDLVIAQGLEAGGHRGHFLSMELGLQMDTVSLVQQLLSKIDIPVVAAGGISDAKSVARIMSLGAAGVQVGTAYLLCPEAKISAIHRSALKNKEIRETALTNLFSGRPARGIINQLMKDIGPLNPEVPDFPLAGSALSPLKKAAEKIDRDDFSSLWCGSQYQNCQEKSAADITRLLCQDIT
ncbi:nitronate monooxygenase [Aurantivibrio infirmus]